MIPRRQPSGLDRRRGAARPKAAATLLRCGLPFLLFLVVMFISIIGDTSQWRGERRTSTQAAVRTVTTTEKTSSGVDASKGTTTTTKTTPMDVWSELLETVTKEKLTKMAQDLKDQYASAQPFPHIVIDDLFPPSVLEAVMAETPESLVQAESGCLSKSMSQHTGCHRAKPGDPQYHKSALNLEEKMGPHTRMLAAFLMSGIFLEFLKELTGIRGLVPDPIFNGGGMHFTSNGGNLQIHSDYNEYPGPKLDRRVNTFLFFNPDWQDEYGGHLELWTPDMAQCKARIAPLLGRFVVFSTSDFSFHGHPEPLTAPPGRSRRSMANYYYTVGRPVEDCATPDCAQHGTLWQTPKNGCTSCLDPACNALPLSPTYTQ